MTPELARQMAETSREIGRQLGVLANRKGSIDYVIVGDAKSLVLPDFKRVRTATSRFRGLRCVHTHLRCEPLSRDDLNDLASLRLDMMVALGVLPDGLPGPVLLAHLMPYIGHGDTWKIHKWRIPAEIDVDFREMIRELEREFARSTKRDESSAGPGETERAILVGVAVGRAHGAEESMEELIELVRSSGLKTMETVIQQRQRVDPKYVLGRGKVEELIVQALQLNADIIIFDRNLTPAQVRALSDFTDLKIIDRTQLILDIFAQRAKSLDGKIQVELAQLKYLLPRLATKNTAMSRLTGGIGGRGPGETKLEINRRRVRERIARLEKDIKGLKRSRMQARAKRRREGIPIISIIGYTNAGKSTLLNTLTNSEVLVEDRLFATLDPTSRRLRFPRERDVIITDTVGFIRDLPDDLVAAFRATLEQLEDAHLLIHLVDMSNPRLEDHIGVVEEILRKLELDGIARLLVFNMADRVDARLAANLCRSYNGISISAIRPSTLTGLLDGIETILWGRGSDPSARSVGGHRDGRRIINE